MQKKIKLLNCYHFFPLNCINIPAPQSQEEKRTKTTHRMGEIKTASFDA